MCCLVDRDRADDVRVGLRLLGVPDDALPADASLVHPEVRPFGESVLVVMFGTNAELDLVPWAFAAGPAGVLVVGDPDCAEVRSSVAAAPDDAPFTVLAAAVLGLARTVPDVVQELSDTVPTAVHQGMSRADERSHLRDLRARLFVLQTMFAAQSQALGGAEELAGLTGKQGDRLLRRAQAVFGFSSSSCARVYALAGDLLSEQSSMVNERLTLVSTLFLPLTAATGFFGMNFTWMTDRIGGLAAFAVLGLAVPALTTLLTLYVIRRMGATGT